jgi:EAL domain-containing protein (putative c-di-GMP-specific phosphodiesterase class I)/CRP-like cAMP-binding protein
MFASQESLNREKFDTGAIVFRAGDHGDAAYVIESGCVEVLVETNNQLHRTAILSKDAMFGEIALLDGKPRMATVRTLAPTTLMRIDRAHIHELLNRADPVIQYLVKILLERFRNAYPAPKKPHADLEPEDQAPPLPAPPGDTDYHATAIRTLLLVHDLAKAIDTNQLVLFYQPIMVLEDRTLAGFEALVRWRHPTLGMISPVEFIPLAEKTGLIKRVGQWVLRQAAKDWQELRTFCDSEVQQTPFISINLSSPELFEPNIVESIQSIMSEHDVPMDELRIELTESILISNLPQVSSALKRLRALGVGIALDDFGTGYAGLDYLQNLPFTCLKIDRSFINMMEGSGRSMQIVRSALELSRLLGMTSVAEGIEDEDTAKALTQLGCTYAQGFHFGKPMAVSKVAAWQDQLL